ncbi:MAG: hypothetical protein EBS05_08630 [Proteobacteria bacterium]|nr:hypothetical protein [Pseudomonadota bacterium]
MKLLPTAKRKAWNVKWEAGSATVLVFALVVILVAILASNQFVLHNLKRELKLIEQQQLKKYHPPVRSRPATPPP